MLDLGGGGDSNFTMRMIAFSLLLMFLVPLFFTLFVPHTAEEDTRYLQEIEELQSEYYLSTGQHVSPSTETWALVGIYTPFTGDKYGITDDGWIYGSKVDSYVPRQYNSSYSDVIGGYEVELVDGLYYYKTVDTSVDLTHTPAKKVWNDGYTPPAGTNPGDPGTEANWHYDYSEASLYTAVSMDNEHISTVFFTPGGKTKTDEGYYYEYTGYRYAFGPLRSYQTDIGGVETTVVPGSSSLSLIWYQYSTLNGIAGQLTISGSDQGLSYLSASDILRAFNQSTYSSTFDMMFNNVSMHLTIRLDPIRIAQGESIENCYNKGYWSVVVTSDAIAASSLTDSSYEFNPSNIFDTLVKLFTFRIAEDYDIDGWVGILASLLITMPLYAALIALALSNYYILIGVAILAAIQGLSSWWPF